MGTRTRSTAAERAYARRAQRRDRWPGIMPDRNGNSLKRAPFVLLVMGLLATGLITTLTLSTAAATDSYNLQRAQEGAKELSEQVEQLRREVALMESPTELARQAKQLGLVPAGNPARLVVRPDGSVELVGDPVAVRGRPSPQPVPPPIEQPAQQAPPEQALLVDQQPPAERPVSDHPPPWDE